MGITAIRFIINNSNAPIGLWNQENNTQVVELDPSQTRSTEIWIPWCTSKEEFKQLHFIALMVDDQARNFAIWQCADRDGDWVRFSTDCRYHGKNDGIGNIPGDHVPGFARADGDRRLEIKPDHTFEFSKFP